MPFFMRVLSDMLEAVTNQSLDWRVG